jgi:hypothetical protein
MTIYYCLNFFGLPQPGGPGSCIYFPQEQRQTLLLIMCTDHAENTASKRSLLLCRTNLQKTPLCAICWLLPSNGHCLVAAQQRVCAYTLHIKTVNNWNMVNYILIEIWKEVILA